MKSIFFLEVSSIKISESINKEDSQKYEFTPTSVPDQISEIYLENIQDKQYLGTLWYGEPAQEMKVLFDTGSAGMYLITDDCKSTSCDSNLIKKYDSK
jgi:hypothetical protein